MIAKKILLLNYLLLTFSFVAQTDTTVWEYTRLFSLYNLLPEGYHIFKKNGIKVREFLVSRKAERSFDKEYYDNGSIKLVTEKIHLKYGSYSDGDYKAYFENGNPKQEGCLKLMDSIECVGCAESFDGRPKTKASTHIGRVDTWKEYYPNGKIKSKGSYNGIHETGYSYETLHKKATGVGVFQPGDYSEDYIKDGLWQYFDETGRVIKEELFFHGWVAKVVTYSYKE